MWFSFFVCARLLLSPQFSLQGLIAVEIWSFCDRTLIVLTEILCSLRLLALLGFYLKKIGLQLFRRDLKNVKLAWRDHGSCPPSFSSFSNCICIHLTNRTEKFYQLCMMTQKLYAFAKGECMEDNPDSLMNHEVLTPGQLFLMFLKVRSWPPTSSHFFTDQKVDNMLLT